MRAVVIERFGDPSGMTVVDLPEPEAGPGEAVIATEAIGVGGVDAVIRRGTLGSGFPPGHIPGSEVAGQVVAVGAGVDRDWLGRRVWAFTGTGGGYVERARARIGDVVPLPPRLSSVDAVALGGAAPVAHFALRHAHFSPGESVLVRGAAGSIGIATVELAARVRAASIAVTTSSAARGALLRRMGATHVLDRRGIAGDGDAEAPEVFDVIIDIVGGPELPDFLDRLAPNGRLVLVGAVGGFPPADFGLRLLQAFQQSRSFATFSLDTVPTAERDAVRAAHFEEAARGELHAIVDDVLPLEDAAEAHRRMDVGDVMGRFVLTP